MNKTGAKLLITGLPVAQPSYSCELPTELEAQRESSELTVKTETVGYVNITSNWISEIQQCF